MADPTALRVQARNSVPVAVSMGIAENRARIVAQDVTRSLAHAPMSVPHLARAPSSRLLHDPLQLLPHPPPR